MYIAVTVSNPMALDGMEWWSSEEGAIETIATRRVNGMCRWPFLCTERRNYCNNMLQRSIAPAFSLFPADWPVL
jgi:hypothetical protein